ncbi:MAG: polysaccharide biosynthesis tyrosine autokinase [Thermoguttaceae bacterium]
MMEEPLAPHTRAENKASSHVVHALLQFAMAVRHRKTVVILCVFVSLALGALYYSTATRLYAARAELLILASGDDVRSTGIAGQGSNGKNLMQTFERLISRSNVIEAAIEGLRPEDRVDLAEVPRSKWVAAIQRNLTAKSIYGTNNIEIEYLSRDPAAAVAVVNQVVFSYLQFMDVIHKRTAEELIRSIQEQQAEISNDLESWQILLSRQKSDCGDFLNTDPDSKTQHPMFERLSNIAKEQWERKKERLDTESKLGNLQEAAARGDDLQPHIMAVEETVGREMLIAVLGLNAQDKAGMAEIRRQRVKDVAELEALLAHYGEGHPEVQSLKSAIFAADQALANGYENNGQEMTAQERNLMARSLLGLLRQRVDGLVRLEAGLASEWAKVWKEAEGINGQLIKIQAIERQIEWGNELRDRLLNQLAALTGVEDGPIIRAETVSDPVQATAPTSPNLRRVALLALLGGLSVGLAAIYVLDTLDDRFRSVEELQAQVGVPVLAIVQDLPRRDGQGVAALQLVAAPDAPQSEAFRTLRTSLGLGHDHSRRIVVTSAEPGDGKTTVLANMAVAYANSGKRTLLIDADMRRPGLSVMLGARGAEGLSTLVRMQAPIGGAVERHVRKTGVPGLDLLPSGPRPMNPAELLGAQSFADLLSWAESRYDRVLIDSPPALAASDTAIIGQLVDGVLLVIQPLKNERRLVLRAVEGLRLLKIPVIGMVANRVGDRAGSGYYSYAVDYSADGEDQIECSDGDDELDCPPERSMRGHDRSGREVGIDLSHLRDRRRRDAA